MRAAIDMGLKGHTLVIDLVQVCERKDLKPATVRQDRSLPVHETMQLTEPLDPLMSRPEVKMIRIAQNDLRPHALKILGAHGLHSSLRSHGHEDRRLDHVFASHRSRKRDPSDSRPRHAR